MLAVSVYLVLISFFCFNKKTSYEMRISDWSSDVCSSDLSGGCRFDDGTRVDVRDGVSRIAFSPAGRWFAACSGKRGVLLWDRQRDRRHRLRSWQLCEIGRAHV